MSGDVSGASNESQYAVHQTTRSMSRKARTVAVLAAAYGLVGGVVSSDTGSGEEWPLYAPRQQTYSDPEARKIAAQCREERRRRKAEAWAKRQPKIAAVTCDGSGWMVWAGDDGEVRAKLPCGGCSRCRS